MSGYLGTVLHGVGEQGVRVRMIAELIGCRMGLPFEQIREEDVGEHFGWLSALVDTDAPASSGATSALLGWRPTGPGLLADMDSGEFLAPPVR